MALFNYPSQNGSHPSLNESEPKRLYARPRASYEALSSLTRIVVLGIFIGVAYLCFAEPPPV